MLRLADEEPDLYATILDYIRAKVKPADGRATLMRLAAEEAGTDGRS